MKPLTTITRLKRNLLTVLMLIVSMVCIAQIDSVNQISVLARPSLDSIVLRWAPINVDAWIRGIKSGYTVERYTMVRDSKIVNPSERWQLTEAPILPWTESRWENLVQNNKYAAIAAQALFGSEFEMSLEGTDVFQIVNKVQENEMRFSFALYAADLSVPVSMALGLRIADKDVKKGEKYLYRILSVHEGDTIRGSIFLGPEEYELPAPIDFAAEFKGNVVSLKWDQSYHRGIYTAYIIERAEDGKKFEPISEDALVTLTPEDKPETRYQYATDSIPDLSKVYAYRVKGITPFGEEGPTTDPIKGRGSISISDVPYISNDDSPDNQVIDLTWDFPVALEAGLKGFDVRRTSSPGLKQANINKVIIAPSLRTFRDDQPNQNNYYQVVAISLDGEEFKSPVRLSQLIDSIPPAPPIGLLGKVSEHGIAYISWKPNEERDIYGYRIYRGNNKIEEFSQITIEPIVSPNFQDSVNLKTLDRFIYYQVMAIDRNQNHSDLSEILAVKLPDIVPPVTPVFLPVISTKNGVQLQWLPSSSDDVERYDLYTQQPGDIQWKMLTSVLHSSDTIISYNVMRLEEGVKTHFTVVAVDAAGLESAPCEPVVAARMINAVKPPVVVNKPEVNREEKRIRLRWVYNQTGVTRYQVYRAKEGEVMKLYQTITSGTNYFEDRQLVMNSVYTYQVVAMFSSGARSEFSEKVVVEY